MTETKLYLVAMDIYTELPRGKQYYALRQIYLRALRDGRYRGAIVQDGDTKKLLVDSLELTKAESILRGSLAHKKRFKFDMVKEYEDKKVQFRTNGWDFNDYTGYRP